MPIRAMDLHGSRFLEDVDVIKPNGDHDRIVFHVAVLTDAANTDAFKGSCVAANTRASAAERS